MDIPLKLTKVKIKGHKITGSSANGVLQISPTKSMDLQVNPDRLGRKLGIDTGSGKDKEDASTTERAKYDGHAAGVYKPNSKYKTTLPETVDFTFYLDATGVIPGCDSIVDDLEKFTFIAYSYVSTSHRPPIVILEWDESFKRLGAKSMDIYFQLKSFSVNYTLFKRDGTPLRAEVSVSFEEFVHWKEAAEASNSSSPDMTHIRTVEPGFNLAMMCEEVYGGPEYYLDVARYNGLSSVFDIQLGQKIYFPPIQK